MSRFWAAYASVNDDLRHQLVEKAWFGKQVTDDIDERDMPGIKDAPESAPDQHSLYAQTWGVEPAPSDLYGTAPKPEGPDTAPPTGPEPEL